jgi:protein-tyrosine phosphatase
MISRITDKIFIGEQSDAINEHVLKQLKIDCIININDRKLPKENELIHQLKIRYIDYKYETIGNQIAFKCLLQSATEQLEKMLSEDYQNILVHCESGIDRAPFVVTQYIAKQKNLPYAKAFNIVKYYRPSIMFHPEWI